MANGLSMKVLLQLQAKQLNQGINQVKKSIVGLGNTIKGLAGVLAGGLGFAKLAQDLKDTATQLSVAKAMLQNISTEITDTGKALDHYSDNLSFIQKLSKDYNQDQLTLIKGFAQFSAAAKTCNVPLYEQQKIYEALTRAAAGFHMSADQANNMMLAITQMMSKGTVTAEELRRQLGNSLPGAFGLMAQALGVTNPELEKMMRAGEVLASDALPKFADVLNELTEDMTFDSLQGSLNSFKNSWYDLVSNSDFDQFYKKVIDFGTKGLNFIAENFQKIKSAVLGCVAGLTAFVGTKTAFKTFNGFIEKGTQDFEKMKAEIDTLNAANTKLADTNKKLFNSKKVSMGAGGTYTVNKQFNKMKPEDLKAINEYNKNLQQIAKSMKDLGNPLYIKSFSKEFDKIAKQTKDIDKYLVKSGYVMDGFVKTTSKWSALWQGILGTVKSALASLGGMLIISAIVAAASALWNYFKKINDEAYRIKQVTKEYQKEQCALLKNTTEEEQELRRCQKVIRDSKKTTEEHKKAVDKVNEILGLSGKEAYDTNKIFDKTGKLINNDILKGIDLWIRKMKILSMVSSNVNKITEYTNKNVELNSKLEDLSKQYERKTGRGLWSSRFGGGNEGVDRQTGKIRSGTKDQGWIKRNVLPVIHEINANNAVINEANKAIDKYEEELAQLTAEPEQKKELTGTTKEIKDALDDYNESIKELENQKKNGVFNNPDGTVNEEKYQEALMKVQDEAWETIAAFSNLETELKRLGKTYTETADKLKTSYNANLIVKAEKEKQKEEQKGEDAIEDKKKAFAKAFAKWQNDAPVLGVRDSSNDYDKTLAEKYEEDLDIKEKYLRELENWRDRLEDLKITYGEIFSTEAETELNRIIELIKTAQGATDDLNTKAKAAQWVEDLDKAQKKLKEIKFDNIKDFANDFLSLGSAIHNVAQSIATLGDTELSEETEKFFNKLDAGINILNTLAQTVEMISTITEMLNKKKEAELTIDKILASTELKEAAIKLGLIKTENKEEEKSAGVTLLAEKTKQAEGLKTTGVLYEETVAGAASSQASIPILGPILAAAAVAGIVALLSSQMNKFAKGGIVGGNSSLGDNNVVRANSGEMILTKGQQGTLFNMLNGKGGVGGNVEFKIRGTDLIGAINNTNNKKRGI